MKDLSRYNNSKHRLALMAVLVLLGLLYWQLGGLWALGIAVAVACVLLFRYISRKSSAAMAKDRLLRERQIDLAFTADQTGRAAAGQGKAT